MSSEGHEKSKMFEKSSVEHENRKREGGAGGDTYQKKINASKKKSSTHQKKYIYASKKYPGATVWDLTGFVLQT